MESTRFFIKLILKFKQCKTVNIATLVHNLKNWIIQSQRDNYNNKTLKEIKITSKMQKQTLAQFIEFAKFNE